MLNLAWDACNLLLLENFEKKKKKHTIPNWFLNMKHILQIGQFFLL
jgi:hypothetical protein